MPAVGGEDKAALKGALDKKNATQSKASTQSTTNVVPTYETYASAMSAANTNQLLVYGTSNQNPPFIYPGETFHDLSRLNGRPTKIERGYIRRLTEFYQKMDNPPTIFNRRCNFQFQPETVVRTVSANAYDTQFFFNQDPSQLSVPIPGQAGYGFKLLFNREAEVYSRKYKSGNGKLINVDTNELQRQLTNDPEYFINNQWDPSWVCGLGALADIMMLDSVIGQGFNSEMLQIVKQTIESRPPSTDATGDAEDKAEGEETKYEPQWSDESLNPNLGNTAFLTPVPVRVYLSKWMIIEGFITSSTVNFVKFSPRYIPTVATVELSMQALYIGFEKRETMLTQKIPPVDPTASTGNPDELPGPAEKDELVRKQTQEGIDNFFSDTKDQGTDRDSLNDIVWTNTQGQFQFQLGQWNLTPQGDEFRKQFQAANGGDVTFYATGKIKIWWHSYAKNSLNSRVTTKANKPSGSSIEAIDYSQPFPEELADLTHWGTKDNPLVITAEGQIEWTTRTLQTDQYNTNFTGWKFERPVATYKIPFEEEKFNVELEITITATRHGAWYKSPQKAVAKYIVRSDEDQLWRNISIAK